MKNFLFTFSAIILLVACSKTEETTFENIDLIGDWSVKQITTILQDTRSQSDRRYTWKFVRGAATEESRIDATLNFDQGVGSITGKKLHDLSEFKDFKWEKQTEKIRIDYQNEQGVDTTKLFTMEIINADQINLEWVKNDLFRYEWELERN